MSTLAIKAIIALGLPLVVLVAGSYIMSKASGRDSVAKQVGPSAQKNHEPPKPLNQRWQGYDTDAVHDYWNALGIEGRRAEQRFLELDLVFPFFYGAALVAGLMLAWATLGRPFQPAWLMAPVAIAVAADWTENLIQLDQLRGYVESGKNGLQSGWIQVSSHATSLKLLMVSGTLLLLLWLASTIIVRVLKST